MNRGISTAVMDDDLAEAVRDFVRRAAGPSATLDVQAYDGAITLTGTIRSETSREAVTALVGACEGVRSVICEVEVATPDSVKTV